MQRRRFLRDSAWVVFPVALGAAPGGRRAVRPRWQAHPFRLGIASGDPTEQAVVLWTRLAPRPDQPDGGMAREPVRVRWEVAHDESMEHVVSSGEVLALPELAHSVHVDVQGLEPGRGYRYRFIAGGEASPVGRTRTLPPARESVESLRFTTCSCQHWEDGYFSAYRGMVADEPDFVVHLGDYIYDLSWGTSVRRHETTETPRTIDAYRLRHALYKGDADLREAHRRLPFFAVPDNHDALEFDDPAQHARRAAAFQAWYEHMPIRARFRPGSAALPLYRSIDGGRLARISLLDTRQFRDDQEVCRESMDPDFGFGIYRPACEALEDDGRSMLGGEQEGWMARRFGSSPATWNVIASTVPVAPFTFQRHGEPWVYYGAWSAYPDNRRRLLAAIRDHDLANPVILSGDLHSSWVSEIRPSPEAEAIATEFTTTSISSGFPPPLADPVTENLENNPHVRLFEATRRGYSLHEVTPETWQTRMRTISSTAAPDGQVADLAAFVLEEGRPGRPLS